MYHCYFFFFNDTATTEIYTLSLHDALPIYADGLIDNDAGGTELDTSASTGLPKIESGIWSVIAKGTANQYLRLNDSLGYEWGALPGGGDMVEATWATGGAIRIVKGGTGRAVWTKY